MDVGILSLHTGVGRGNGLLSLGLKLDLPVLTSLLTSLGSDNGPVSLGQKLDPHAPSQGAKLDPDEIAPHANVSPSVAKPPTSGHSTTPASPTSPTSPTSPPLSDPATIVAFQLAAQPALSGESVKTVFSPEVIEIQPGRLVGSVDNFLAVNHAATRADSPVESFLSVPRSAAIDFTAIADSSARETPESDDVTEELFRLRDGALLEDFETAIPGVESREDEMNGEVVPSEGTRAMSLWLVGILAGCVAGSIWINRRKAEAVASPDANPCLVPMTSMG